MNNLGKLKKELRSLSSKEQKKKVQRFFKTGKGEYGEGDIFLGIVGGVPVKRKIAKKYMSLSFLDLQNLLDSKIHEFRFIALIILIDKFRKEKENRKIIFDFYIKNAKRINNWDLVDVSAYNIFGEYLLKNKESKKILYKLAKSKNLWERRISIVATFAFIRVGRFKETLDISKLFLKDEQDLIQKAVGWMLREVGKKDFLVEDIFLKKYYKKMPRMMLRYSIERFPEEKRLKYLRGEI